MINQRGAALTETVILMLALLPIMFGIPMIGKLIDLRQSTVQASRYTAWEGTVSSGNPSAPTDVKARFFSDHTVAIGGDASAPNAIWGGDRAGSSSPAVPVVTNQTMKSFMGWDHAAVRLDEATGAALPYTSAYDSGADGTVSQGVQDIVEGTVGSVAKITKGSWIDSGSLKGMLRSEVRADTEGNGLVDTLSFTDATVIMYDTWSPRDDGDAAERARAMVPAGALEVVGEALSILGEFPLFDELKPLDKVFGHVDMNPLPASESPYVSGARFALEPLQPYSGH